MLCTYTEIWFVGVVLKYGLEFWQLAARSDVI